MKVLEFGVGFPPKIFGKKFSVDGTEYSANWLPFGGFVRIFGESREEAGQPGAFGSFHPLKQAAVLFAGPGANILLALILFTGALAIGAPAIIDTEEEAARAHNTYVIAGEVLPGSPAEVAGIRAGDRIISINNTPVDAPEDVARLVAESNPPLTITIYGNGTEREVLITPVTGLVASDPERPAIGVGMALVGVVSLPLHEAILASFDRTLGSVVFISTSIASLIAGALTFSADISSLAGPVGIASLTGEAAAFGFGSLLGFAALLSVNLALVNLLPFPALDGGRLLFLAVEAAIRRKIPHGVAQSLNAAGFALLILLMLAVTIQDISRLVG
jgi:regulator of sigma E protease